MKVYIGRYPKRVNGQQRKVQVRIDKEDTWNMDDTLAHIILPMLKQLKQTKHGAPQVDDVDVPPELRYDATNSPVHEIDNLYFKRWDYIMDEMIFAFESKLTNWEEQFWKKQPQLDFTQHPEDKDKDFAELRWKEVGECDWEGLDAYGKRIQKGFELFGKYYQCLWD